MRENPEARIAVDPEVMVGKPVIKGTRIPVEKILHMLAQGMEVEDILEDYPHLEEEDVLAAAEYAAQTVESESVFPLKKEGEGVEVTGG